MSLDLDRNNWTRVRFGDVADRSREQRDQSDGSIECYVAGGHFDEGAVEVTRWGDPDDGGMGSTFTYACHPGHVLYVSASWYLRKVGVATFHGVVADKTYVIETRDREVLDQRFLPWILLSDRLHDYAAAQSTGSMNARLLWSTLANFEFDLPPLDEQQRIADVLWSIERHRVAATSERDVARSIVGSYGRLRLSRMPTTVRLGAVAITRSGPSFAASDVQDHAVEGSVPVLGIPNTRPDGTIDLRGAGHVTGLAASVGKIDEASLVLIRTNGNRQRIGNVYLPPPESQGYAVSAFQFLMRSNESVDREYLYWVLSEPTMQKRMSEAASGSVGLGNLAVRWLNERQIPWSTDVSARRSVVDEMRNLARALAIVDSEIAAVVALRSSLLAEFLGGN